MPKASRKRCVLRWRERWHCVHVEGDSSRHREQKGQCLLEEQETLVKYIEVDSGVGLKVTDSGMMRKVGREIGGGNTIEGFES